MTKLDWREEPKISSPEPSPGGAGIWFGVSMALMGVIAGYFVSILLK